MHKTATFYTKVTSDIPASLWEHYVTSYLKWLYHRTKRGVMKKLLRNRGVSWKGGSS